MKLLFPIILTAIGVGGGVGAGLVLRPPLIDAEPEAPCAISQTSPDDSTLNKTVILQETDREYVKLTNQFVVPVVRGEMVTSLVLMSLSLEVGEGDRETIFAREPKLRDALLQVMFDHANAGGFQGAFTNSSKLDALRKTLSDVARTISGNLVSNVLITDIARQDV